MYYVSMATIAAVITVRVCTSSELDEFSGGSSSSSGIMSPATTWVPNDTTIDERFVDQPTPGLFVNGESLTSASQSPTTLTDDVMTRGRVIVSTETMPYAARDDDVINGNRTSVDSSATTPSVSGCYDDGFNNITSTMKTQVGCRANTMTFDRL